MAIRVKEKIFVSIAGLIISNLSFSQQTTRHYLDSLLNISDNNYSKTTDIFFVINGIPYDNNQVDTIISKYDQKYLADAMFLSREKQSYPFHRNVAVIFFASQQKNKTKRKSWKEAKKLFSDQNENSAQLLIDRKPIAPEEAGKTFKILRLKDIRYLDIKQMEDRKLVRIWKTE
jgi:hypothetical protein